MGIGKRQQVAREMRGQMWSPGRPSLAQAGARWFRQGGGMFHLPLAPHTGRYLSFSEREEVAILCAQNIGVREIARRLSRDASTISRELRCNSSTWTYRLEYRATTAQWYAEKRASRPKMSKLAGK